MFASIWIADEELFERIMRDAFASQGEAVREKILEVMQSCRTMLLQQPPERLEEFWSTVSSTSRLKDTSRLLTRVAKLARRTKVHPTPDEETEEVPRSGPVRSRGAAEGAQGTRRGQDQGKGGDQQSEG
jgi:hypothetical protein